MRGLEEENEFLTLSSFMQTFCNKKKYSKRQPRQSNIITEKPDIDVLLQDKAPQNFM